MTIDEAKLDLLKKQQIQYQAQDDYTHALNTYQQLFLADQINTLQGKINTP